MGGSGDSYLPAKGGSLADQVREALKGVDEASYSASVDAKLGEVLAQANNRDVETVSSHLEAIRSALELELDGVISLVFGGSVSKNTFVQGISDVDALVVVNQTELASKGPAAVCDFLLSRLRESLRRPVSADGFAINVDFDDMRVQLIPVLKRGENLMLPNEDCSKWSRARPAAFAAELSAVNQNCGRKVVPTIKLVKVLLSRIPDRVRPTGYHIENLAVTVFKNYEGPFTLRKMLHYFFQHAPQCMRTPIKDRSGQSEYVDENLGPVNSVERLMASDSVARIGRRLLLADSAGDVQRWAQILEGWV